MRKPSRRVMLIVLFTVFATIGQLATGNERRMGLVIGNSDYQFIPKLKNPAHDAKVLARALSALGFTVFLADDLTGTEMRKALNLFAQKSQDADLRLFYFAGHGRQKTNEISFLPVDWAAASGKNSLRMEEVLNSLSGNMRRTIVVVDACRENGTQTDQQIALPNPPPETLISFATAAGTAAYDGTGQHSLFAGALLDHLANPDLDITLMLRKVRRDVLSNSDGKQIPQTLSALVSPLILNQQSNTEDSFLGLSDTGYSEKPLLRRIKREEHIGASGQETTKRQSILRRFCAALPMPLPESCL